MGISALALIAPLAATALACSIDDRMLTTREPAILLRPDVDGRVGPNDAGILGAWSASVDTDDCVARGFSADQCSRVVAPPAGFTFPPSDLQTGRMCTSGVVARLVNDPATMSPAYGTIWGANIQLSLNNQMAYDAVGHGITGFSFEIDRPVRNGMKVSFPTANGLEPPYWGGKAADVYSSPVEAGFNVVRWADVGGPAWLPDAPAFDPRTLTWLQIWVNVSPDQETPFDFCISNLAARTD